MTLPGDGPRARCKGVRSWMWMLLGTWLVTSGGCTCIIDADRVPDAVRALHNAFQLETPE